MGGVNHRANFLSLLSIFFLSSLFSVSSKVCLSLFSQMTGVSEFTCEEGMPRSQCPAIPSIFPRQKQSLFLGCHEEEQASKRSFSGVSISGHYCWSLQTALPTSPHSLFLTSSQSFLEHSWPRMSMMNAREPGGPASHPL